MGRFQKFVGAFLATLALLAGSVAPMSASANNGNYVRIFQLPKVTLYTSGSGTFTPDPLALYRLVTIKGGGSGGGQSSSNASSGGTAPGAGSNSTFGSLTANGATAPSYNVPGAVSTGTGTGCTTYTKGLVAGTPIGGTSSTFYHGGNGAGPGAITSSVLGGAGQAATGATGSGGQGGGLNSTAGAAGAGGNEGDTCTAWQNGSTAGISYGVGAGGAASVGAANYFAGGAGTGGYELITEYYQ